MSLQISILQTPGVDLPPHRASLGVPAFNDPRANLVIAEDNELLRDLLAFELTARGYFVRCAEDGESGWESLTSAPFDLLITDQDMPRLTGLDLLRRMRASSLHQPAILMSGNLPQLSPEVEALLSPGAALGKPFSFTDLFPKIEALLGLNRSGAIPHRVDHLTPV